MKIGIKAMALTILTLAVIIGLLVLVVYYDIVFYFLVGTFVVLMIGCPIYEFFYEVIRDKTYREK